jgi:hypothetical protein
MEIVEIEPFEGFFQGKQGANFINDTQRTAAGEGQSNPWAVSSVACRG